MAESEDDAMSQADINALMASVDALEPDAVQAAEPVAAPGGAVDDASPMRDPNDFAGIDGMAEPDAVRIQPARLKMASFDDSGPAVGAPMRGFDRVQDIPLELTVELGRTKLLIKDVLDLGAGSIVELEKIAGEPVDVLANGLLIARGEVVVIEDNFGVRITEIITSAERKTVIDDATNILAA